MSVGYTTPEINGRLNAVVTVIDANGNGNLLLQTSSGSTLSTIQLAKPSATVSNEVMTFGGQLLDPAASGTGNASQATIQDGIGNTIISGLTVGISSAVADIALTNGLNSTLISSGQTISVTSAKITGA